MLDTSPENLLAEIEYAESERDKRLKGVDISLARYAGPDRAERTGYSKAPRNVEYEFISYLSSLLAFDNPVVSIESPLVSSQDETLALEIGMGRWAKDTKVVEQLRLAVPDFAAAWAVFMVTNKPAPELGEVTFKDKNGLTRRGLPNRPHLKRISFRRAFKDPLATSPWDMRFAGHTEIADKNSTIKAAEDDPKAGWNVEALRKAATDADLKRAGRKDNDGSPPRNEIAYWELWVGDAEVDWEKYGIPKEDRCLYHGMIFTIGIGISENGKDPLLLRERPFFGPRWGPYVFGGAHIIPDDPYFLSPIQPMRTSIDQLNLVLDTADKAMEKYKRLLLLFGASDEQVEIIRSGKHDHVFALDGEPDQVTSLELGGITNQMSAHLAMMEERVNIGLGMGDAMKGAVSGDGSATENVIAAESAAARMAMCERQWFYATSQALLGVCFYFVNDDEMVQPLSMGEAMQVGVTAPEMLKRDEAGNPVMLRGKAQFEQPYMRGGASEYPDLFDSLALDVQAYSTKRMSERSATEKAVFLQNFVVNVLPLVPTMPHGQWDILLRLFARWTDTPEYRQVVNLRVAAELAQSQALAQYAAQNETDGPRTAKDAGGSAAQGPKPPAAARPEAATNQQSGRGGANNAAGAKAPAMPGRSAGATSGNRAASRAGAA